MKNKFILRKLSNDYVPNIQNLPNSEINMNSKNSQIPIVTILYYLQLLHKNNEMAFDTYLNVSKALAINTYHALTPYIKYLERSIEAIQKKQIQAKWKKVIQNEIFVELIPLGKLFEIQLLTKIKLYKYPQGTYLISFKEIEDADFTQYYGQPLYLWINGNIEQIYPTEKDFLAPNIIKLDLIGKISKANWVGESVELIPAWTQVLEGDTIYQNDYQFDIINVENDIITVKGFLNANRPLYNQKQEYIHFEVIENNSIPDDLQIISQKNNCYVVYVKPNHNSNIIPPIANQISSEQIYEFVNLNSLIKEDGSKIMIEHHENNVFKILDTHLINTTVKTPENVMFRIQEIPIKK